MEQKRLIAALVEAFGFVSRHDDDGPQRRLWQRASDAVNSLPHVLNDGGDPTQLLRVIAFTCGELPGGADAQACAGSLAALLGVSLFGKRVA